ncbi:MAG: FIST N-terminal domain-containing protein [Candidatus Omnitrophota bacterium]
MAIKVGMGLGLERDLPVAVQNAVRQAKAQIQPNKIHLAVVFSTVEFAKAQVIKTLYALLGQVRIVGASSLGLITNQGIFRHGLAIMLLSLPESTFCNTAFVQEVSAKSSTSAGEELGEKLLAGFKNHQRDFSLLFSDGLIRDGSGFLYGLKERLGWSFPLAGACASDNFEFKKTYVFFNEQASSDAACGILWGGRMNFGLGIKHGWKALGQPRTVTKASGNTVYEIDGKAAVSLYKDYFDYDIYRLRNELRRLSIMYPIGMYLEGEQECLLRNVVSLENDTALVCQGHILEGSVIRLMIGTKESCLAATQEALDEAKTNLLGKHADFVFVFDSISRYMLLGRRAQKELDIIKQGLGENTPIMGMYSLGEQAPLKAVNFHGRVYFHNQTISILGMGG